MEKLIYLLHSRPSQDRGDLGSAVRAAAGELEDIGASWISVHVADDTVSIPGPMPCPDSELPLRAAVSVWVPAHDLVDPTPVLSPVAERCDGYLVTESVWSEYGQRRGQPRRWPVGERSPGITTVALVTRNPQLDPRTFRELWYGRQSPMSEAVQPRLRYVRNTVVHPVSPGAPPLDGIVMESWPSEEVVDDLLAFHLDDAENLTVMMDTVALAFDMSRLRSVAMAEYLLH